MNKSIKFQHIIRKGEKVYAFSGNDLPFECKEELLSKLKKNGRSLCPGELYKGRRHKNFDDFTKEEVDKEIDDDFKFLMKLPNDVFSMFKKYFGIDLYNLNNSDCLKNEDIYIPLFTKEDAYIIKNSGRKYKSFWHFISGYMNMCPKVATINFKNILDDLEDMDEESFGAFGSFSNSDLLWISKILKILHKTFGDKQKFYFSKWNYVQNPKISNLNLKY